MDRDRYGLCAEMLLPVMWPVAVPAALWQPAVGRRLRDMLLSMHCSGYSLSFVPAALPAVLPVAVLVSPVPQPGSLLLVAAEIAVAAEPDVRRSVLSSVPM